MKKFINNNDDFLKESLTGFGKAHSDIINVNLDPSFVSRKNKTKEKLKIGEKMTGGPNAIGFEYFYGFTHARNIQTVIEQDIVVREVKPVENQPLMIARAVDFLKEQLSYKTFGKPLDLEEEEWVAT